MSHVAQYGENCKSWDEACDAVNGTSQQSIPNDGENSAVKTKTNQQKSKTKPRKNNNQTKHHFKN